MISEVKRHATDWYGLTIEDLLIFERLRMRDFVSQTSQVQNRLVDVRDGERMFALSDDGPGAARQSLGLTSGKKEIETHRGGRL